MGTEDRGRWLPRRKGGRGPGDEAASLEDKVEPVQRGGGGLEGQAESLGRTLEAPDVAVSLQAGEEDVEEPEAQEERGGGELGAARAAQLAADVRPAPVQQHGDPHEGEDGEERDGESQRAGAHLEGAALHRPVHGGHRPGHAQAQEHVHGVGARHVADGCVGALVLQRRHLAGERVCRGRDAAGQGGSAGPPTSIRQSLAPQRPTSTPLAQGSRLLTPVSRGPRLPLLEFCALDPTQGAKSIAISVPARYRPLCLLSMERVCIQWDPPPTLWNSAPLSMGPAACFLWDLLSTF